VSAFKLSTTIPRTDITGLVLAGGMGSRMGGQDKGLMPYLGEPLVLHVLRRLAPQVGSFIVSANRHHDEYASLAQPFQAQVCADELPESVPAYPGPLAGMLTGLLHCTTPYLAVVPCDVPHLPLDLVDRLAHQLLIEHSRAALAVAAGRRQPALCLLSKSLAADLADYLSAGHRKLDGCLARWQACEVLFDDPLAFRNFNTPEQLNA
jgi:molybdopterin-guanine dinucleotide biosynthesis protein A